MSDLQKPSAIDTVIKFMLYLTAALVPLVYYNNPIATEYFFSKAFFFDLLVYGAFVLFFIRAILRGELTIRWGYTFLPLALFCVVALQSLIGAENVWKGWETVVRVGACLPFMFLLYQEAGTKDAVRRFLFVAAITNIGVTAYGFLQFYEVFPLPRDQYGTADPSTTIGLTNFVMEYMTPFMFVIPAMILVSQRRLTRLVFVVAALFQYYYFVISDNRAAMVGWGAALPIGAVLLYSQYRRGTFRFKPRTWAAAAIVGIVAMGLLFSSPQGQRMIARAKTIMNYQGTDDAITFRLQTWKQSLSIIKDYPLRGVGLSNLEVMFPVYQSPYLEWMTLKKNTRVVRAHNEYVQVLADLGIIGGLVFAFFLFRLGKLAVIAFRRTKAWDDMLVVTGFILGIWSYLVVAFFAFPFEVPSSALSIFLIIGLLEVMARRVLVDNDDPKHTFAPKLTGAIAWPALAVTALFWVYASTWMWHVLRAEVYFKESRVMKDLQQYETARGLLDEAIKHYPQNEAYYYDRSIFAIRDGDVNSAIKDLKMTATLVPNYAMGHKQIGLLAAQMGRYDEAAKELEIAFKIYKTQHDEYIPLLINAYIGSGQTAKAFQYAEAVSKSSSPDMHLAMGQAHISALEYAKAIPYLERAIELKPGNADAYTFLGMAYVKSGQFEKALSAYDAAESGGGNNKQKSAAAVGRATALMGLKRAKEAKEVVRAALATDPTSIRFFSEEKSLVDSPDIRPLLVRE